MKRLIVLLSALLSSITVTHAGALPRSLEELGIPVQVTLSMPSAELNRIKGDVVKSGRFVSVRAENGYQLSMKLDPEEKRVNEIVIALKKGSFGEILAKVQELYTKGNLYEKEKGDAYESHVWSDGSTRIGLIRSRAGDRLELSEKKE